MNARRNWKWMMLSVVLLAALLAVNFYIARAATITVCSSGCDYTMIQAAINAATPGDTIQVGAGTYAGQIQITKSITLLGDPGDASPGPGGNAPLIDGGSTPGDAFLINNGVTNVTIQGFEIANFTSNDDGIGNGISAWVASTSNITIQDNYFHDLGWNGVLVGNDGAIGDHQNWTIKANILEEFAFYGFELTNTSNSTIEGNIIHATTPENPITCIMVGARKNESDITIKGNLIDGDLQDFSDSFAAIYIFTANWDGPEGNLDEVLIENNDISTSGTAPHIFFVEYADGQITNAKVFNNSLGSIWSNAVETINASGNWLGSNAPGDVKARVSSTVDYTPWLAKGTDTSTDPGFQGDFSNLWVDDDSPQTGSTGRIQEGINLVSGSTVNVAAGTYVEGPQLVIDKDISIVGEDKATTIITPSADTSSQGEARGWFLVQSGTEFNLSGVTLDGAGKNIFQAIRSWGSGTIDDSIFKNIVYPGYNGMGIALFGNMTVSGNEFSNIGRIGVIAFGTDSTAAVISGNSFTGKGAGDWLDYAVELGGGAQATVSGNTISDNLGVASSDGSESAGIIVTTYYGAGTAGTITNNHISNSTYGIAVGIGASDTSSVTASNNCFSGNEYGVTSSGPEVDAKNNWWGDPSGPKHATNPLGSGDEVTDYVSFIPWLNACGGSTVNFQNISTGQAYLTLQDAVDGASAGQTIIPLAPGPWSGSTTINKNGLTIKLNGATFTGGSPAMVISADDVTVQGPGTFDGGGSSDAAIEVLAGADNFILDGVEITGWNDGVWVKGAVESLKIVNNWIHNNSAIGLNVAGTPTGVVTIEGNLFKANTGVGVAYSGGGSLDATYNSWGDVGGPAGAKGDGVGAGITFSPWTFSEIYFDLDPATAGDQYQRHVAKTDSFDVAIMGDAANLYGLSFIFSYDNAKLALNSTTFTSPWDGGACTPLAGLPPGQVGYRCNLIDPTPQWNGGTIATFNFTANVAGTAYFDVKSDDSLSSGAVGGVKVFVNNAGFGDASTTDRDVTDTNDGELIIDLANFTGFIDLQGRPNDSGALLEVWSTNSGGTKMATATSASSGKYTTAYESGQFMVLGTTYYLYVDRALYLPTVGPAYPSATLNASPTTALNSLLLLGGDGTDDDMIDSNDAACIGSAYGTNSNNCTGGAGANSDVNGDGIVNIYDLTLMGGNYNKTYSQWTPQ